MISIGMGKKNTKRKNKTAGEDRAKEYQCTKKKLKAYEMVCENLVLFTKFDAKKRSSSALNVTRFAGREVWGKLPPCCLNASVRRTHELWYI